MPLTRNQIIIISVVILLLLIGGGVGGYFIYKSIKDKKDKKAKEEEASKIVGESDKAVSFIPEKPSTLKSEKSKKEYTVLDMSLIPPMGNLDKVDTLISYFFSKCQKDKGNITIAHDIKKDLYYPLCFKNRTMQILLKEPKNKDEGFTKEYLEKNLP